MAQHLKGDTLKTMMLISLNSPTHCSATEGTQGCLCIPFTRNNELHPV